MIGSPCMCRQCTGDDYEPDPDDFEGQLREWMDDELEREIEAATDDDLERAGEWRELDTHEARP